MKLNRALKEIGLSKIEVEIYLTLLKTAGAQPASVIANRTSLNRTTTYKALINLAKMGLTTKTMKHGIICFFSEAPEDTLKALVEERRSTLDQVNASILEALPSLIAGEENSAYLPKIRYYEGIDGIRQIYDAILKEEEDYYHYGDIAKIYAILGESASDHIKRRMEKGITARAIMPYHKQNEELYKKDKEGLVKTLYVPHSLFPIEGEVGIFGNKVAILSLKKDFPIGVIIESDTVTKMFHSIFMLTWREHTQETFKS